MEVNRLLIAQTAFKDVAEEMGLTEGWINTRYRHYADIRSCIYNYLCRDRKLTLSEVSRAVDKTHATVINGLRNYDQLKDQPDFKETDIQVRSVLTDGELKTYAELVDRVTELEKQVKELINRLNECNGSKSK